jgi:hypothetical protein
MYSRVCMRKKTLFIVLVILTFGVIGTILSTFYEKSEYLGNNFPFGLTKVSYGFPLAWRGYSYYVVTQGPRSAPMANWFSLESLLLDAVFWFVISFFVSISTVQLGNILRKTRAMT